MSVDKSVLCWIFTVVVSWQYFRKSFVPNDRCAFSPGHNEIQRSLCHLSVTCHFNLQRCSEQQPTHTIYGELNCLIQDKYARPKVQAVTAKKDEHTCPTGVQVLLGET